MVLSETWFLEGYIDFELQKYRLLAYLKEVRQNFDSNRLYPQLADIVFHYNNLLSFRNNKHFMQDQFPRRLERISTNNLELVYQRMLADSELMQELEQITSFALEEMQPAIQEGAGIYDFVEQQLQIEPVGIMPLYKNEGYVLVRYGSFSEVRVYNFSITLFEHKDAKYRGIKLEYIDSREKTLANTWEQIKIDIVRSMRALPNPAVYKVEFPFEMPYYETLLPVTRRVLARKIEAS